MLLRVFTCLLFVWLTSAAGASSGSLKGRVVSISDGDTVILLSPDNKRVKIRLAGIDAPERGQPWGNNARRALSQLVFKQVVRVQVTDIDSYGRTVGRLFDGAVDVNAEMVRTGDAWVYRRYTSDPHLVELEQSARDRHTGLWSLPESQRIPPWKWRQDKRDADKSTSAAGADWHCGAKHYCSQMSSCAEARFFLQQCHVTTIDGDRDGVPCEVLCRAPN